MYNILRAYTKTTHTYFVVLRFKKGVGRRYLEGPIIIASSDVCRHSKTTPYSVAVNNFLLSLSLFCLLCRSFFFFYITLKTWRYNNNNFDICSGRWLHCTRVYFILISLPGRAVVHVVEWRLIRSATIPWRHFHPYHIFPRCYSPSSPLQRYPITTLLWPSFFSALVLSILANYLPSRF